MKAIVARKYRSTVTKNKPQCGGKQRIKNYGKQTKSELNFDFTPSQAVNLKEQITDKERTGMENYNPPEVYSQHPEIFYPVVELRQYTLHPNQREVLIELFEREFIESQEAVGMNPFGIFRNLDDPDQFVWLRGFSDMATRGQALPAFYGGPTWKANSKAANATMIDSDNVLLLRPARPSSGFSLENRQRNPAGSRETSQELVAATIYYFAEPVGEDFLTVFEGKLKPILQASGASVLAYFVTEDSQNNFPALPVREGDNVMVWFAKFQNKALYEKFQAALSDSNQWQDMLAEVSTQYFKKPPELLKLTPTARSLI